MEEEASIAQIVTEPAVQSVTKLVIAGPVGPVKPAAVEQAKEVAGQRSCSEDTETLG